MKMNGTTISGPNIAYAVIPRPSKKVDEVDSEGKVTGSKIVSGNLVFTASAVLDDTNFEKLCPRPRPPLVTRPGGISSLNTEDEDYKKAMNVWGANKVNWIILESLKATETLQWETVDLSDYTTWVNYRKELQDSGFSVGEVKIILAAVWEANALDEQKLDAARESFLSTKQ